MTATRDGSKCSVFSVMQSALCFSNVKILAVPTTSFINNSRHLGTVDPIFVGKERLNAMSALENNPEIHAAIKFSNADLQLFGNNFALHP